jgi:D-3-phosphoglycerate dehydrogenase
VDACHVLSWHERCTIKRGWIQEGALISVLNDGLIVVAGLDVFEKEPPDVQNPLFQLQNVIATPHTAALTKDAVAKLAEGSAENAINVLNGKPPSYSANWEEVQAKAAQ